MDYKGWIQEKAEEIAQETFHVDFYSLMPDIRDVVYERAIDDYKDHMADQIDGAREYAKYNERCPSCNGSGRLVTECCNGAGGCSCKGDLVDIGICRVCNGYGYVVKGHYDPNANSKFIRATRMCFAGSGPTTGYWADKPSYNGTPVNNKEQEK